jgi:nucleoside-diphosphate-sugar epimerase
MGEAKQQIFLTGGTGYMGSRLIPRLLSRGHRVTALVRPQSQGKLPFGCEAVAGNALDANSYRERIKPATIFVQLVGSRIRVLPKQRNFGASIWSRGERRSRRPFLQAFSISFM